MVHIVRTKVKSWAHHVHCAVSIYEFGCACDCTTIPKGSMIIVFDTAWKCRNNLDLFCIVTPGGSVLLTRHHFE